MTAAQTLLFPLNPQIHPPHTTRRPPDLHLIHLLSFKSSSVCKPNKIPTLHCEAVLSPRSHLPTKPILTLSLCPSCSLCLECSSSNVPGLAVSSPGLWPTEQHSSPFRSPQLSFSQHSVSLMILSRLLMFLCTVNPSPVL